MDINEMNRIRKLMHYTFDDIAGVSGLPSEDIQRILEPRPEDLKILESAILRLIRRDEASGNIIHETIRPYQTGQI